MPRWLLWTPLAALTVAAAFFGLRAGNYVSGLSESDVINAAAQSYLSGDAVRSKSDCAAAPAQEAGLWLTITCQPAQGPVFIYNATRLGQIHLATPAAKQPET